MFRYFFKSVLILVLVSFALPNPARALVHVTVRQQSQTATSEVREDGKIQDNKEPLVREGEVSDASDAVTSGGVEFVVSGRLLADYRAGNEGLVAVEETSGKYRIFHACDVVSVTEDEEPFIPLTRKEMQLALKEEFPSFDTLATDHFLFVYDTSEGYAAWCGKLFESLYESFERYRRRLDLDLEHPKVPMVVVLFGGKEEFLKYAQEDTDGATQILAYYHRLDNRTILYDLSEVESQVPSEKRRSRSYKQVSEILSRPQAGFNVATIVHEATHQIAFNRGMFPRTGPFALWLAEGVSMYFETPDSRSRHGWTGRGLSDRPNSYRLAVLREFAKNPTPDPLQQIVRETDYLKDAQNSYALSWSLFYYLNEKTPKKLAKYIDLLREKTPFTVYSPEERISDFEACFGDDWQDMYKVYSKFFRDLD
ncbi:MAG: DUF1570 domain-containing protein [Planctomycetia bacterium]|nr:DUF1570 domain-containing protein [Planctomycetia bacterium]